MHEPPTILPSSDTVMEGVPDVDVACAGLAELDFIPSFDPSDAPEVDDAARVAEPQLHLRTPTRRLFADYNANPDALATLQEIPAEGQTLNAVMHQRHSAWDLVPALIAKTGRNVIDLYVATLSYSRPTAADLLGLLDDGRIKRVALVVSHYFRAQNRGIYDALVPPLRERGHRVIACRNHAKLLLLKMRGGDCYVVEGSANLRSCKNVEQFTLTRCRKLYAFHRTWLERDLLSRCKEGGADEARDED